MSLLAALAGCAAFQPGESWVGRPEAELVRYSGTPDERTPDSLGGCFLLYRTGFSAVPDYLAESHQPVWTASELIESFHVNRDGIIDAFARSKDDWSE